MMTAFNAFPTLDRLLDDVMSGVSGTAFGTAQRATAYTFAVDVRATSEEIVFHCDVPGVKQDDLDVSIEAGTLTIKGQRRYEGGPQDQVWLGRSYGAFEKSFTLPDFVDAENMSADLSDGVLTIRVPKKPQAKPRRIPIGGGNTDAKQLADKHE